MATFDVLLLELAVDNFPWAWTKFELVSTAKEWNAAKQTAVLPTLLWGKLVDHYIDLNDTTMADLRLIKDSLDGENKLDARFLDCRKAVYGSLPTHRWKGRRFCSESEEAIQACIPCRQSTDVRDSSTMGCDRIATHPNTTSRKRLDAAMEIAQGVEYALNLKQGVLLATQRRSMWSGSWSMWEDLSTQLQQTLEQMAKWLKTLKTRLQSGDHGGSSRKRIRVPNCRNNSTCGRYIPDCDHRCCWKREDPGHLQRDCPKLNYDGLAQPVGSWPSN